MRIRTLDQDLNANQLQVMWGGNGDVYVTIFVNNSGEARDKYCGIPISVRVGMGGSGMRLPRKIGDLLAELATEFEKYNDNLFESDAEEVDFKKRCEELRKQGEWNIEDAKRKSLSLNEYAIILKGKRYNLVKPNLEGCKYYALDKFCDRFKESLCDAMVGEDKGLIFESEKNRIMDKKNTNTKATIRVEQFDNGITIKWSGDDGDDKQLVTLDHEKERTLGKIIYEDIKAVMDYNTCNVVVMEIEYKNGE